MWTLILTLVIAGHSINTVTVPNLPSKEICRQTGENHIEQYTRRFSTLMGSKTYVGVYTCVETKSN